MSHLKMDINKGGAKLNIKIAGGGEMYHSNCGQQNPDDANFCSKCGSQLKGFLYAGFWRRSVALVIDEIVMSFVAGIIGFIIGFVIVKFLLASGYTFAITDGSPELIKTVKTTTEIHTTSISIIGLYIFIIFVIEVVLRWLYFALFESSSKQATIGKMALGIIVTDLNGNRISFGRANARYWSKIISGLILLIGYIMAGFTKKKQALHDIITGTLVIKKRK
jgi:uncharacterized RDD family membrane protein YckC